MPRKQKHVAERARKVVLQKPPPERHIVPSQPEKWSLQNYRARRTIYLAHVKWAAEPWL